ncbi:MAG: hypothetical protein HY329_26290 [Chloroflexi bacterium]|nr:hypothetical protein [Chloroflexota bacterium]
MKLLALAWLSRGWGLLRSASLLAQYTLAVVMAIGLVGTGLGYRLGQQLESLALQQEATNAANQVAHVLQPFFRADDFDQPLLPERVNELEQLLRERVLGGSIARVKLWNRQGTVIYSDNTALIGRQFEIEHELADALKGEIASELSSLGRADNQTERAQFSRLMEIYAPIYLDGAGIVGAYEVYHDLRMLEPSLAATWQHIWLSLGLGYGALYVATVGLVWQASHRLRRQAVDVARLEAERHLNQVKDELISVVSHELRTPLAGVLGFAELLLIRELPEDERRQCLSLIVKEGKRLSTLLDDFLDLQRMENGPPPLRTKATALDVLLNRAINVAGTDQERPVVSRIPETLPLVDVDPDRLGQVLHNLLSNARKYSPSGGEIALEARVVDSFVEISILDHGLGLPAEALPQLFGKFFRIDNSDRRRITGTGLGLAISKHIIEAHGGRIWAESAGLGQGSRFSFTVPIARAEPPLNGSLTDYSSSSSPEAVASA